VAENRRRKEHALSAASKEVADKIRQLMDKLINEFKTAKVPGFKRVLSIQEDLPRFDKNQPLYDEPVGPVTPGPRPPEPVQPPIHTGDPDDMHVLNNPVRVPTGGGKAVIKLQINAPDNYFERPGSRQFSGEVLQGPFHDAGKGDVEGGILRFTVETTSDARAGDRGTIVFLLERGHDEMPVAREAELIAFDPPQPRVKQANAQATAKVGAPPVEPVRRAEWSDIGFDETTVAKDIADDLKNPGGPYTIWVNWDYPPLDEKLFRERRLDEERATAYKMRFMASMGFLVWLQRDEERRQEKPLSAEDLQRELRRAARVHLASMDLLDA
jgi:hypothetical protein